MACSSKLRAGEMPTTMPFADFAPFTAKCGSPGQAPVIRTHPRRAMVRPISKALRVTSSPRSPPAEPMTPTLMRSLRARSSTKFCNVASPGGDGRPATAGQSTMHGFDPGADCPYTADPSMLPCALLRDRSIASGARLVRAPGLALLLASALALPACGGGGDAGSALGPQEGANHPMVGRKAPDFAAEDPSGLWLPLSNLKGKPVALLFFRPGAAFAPELVAELGRFRADPDNVPTVFLGLARDSMDR